MQASIKGRFPEAECSALEVKHPEHYSSFKVCINSSNLSAAVNPDSWPIGIYVAKFFQKGRAAEKIG